LGKTHPIKNAKGDSIRPGCIGRKIMMKKLSGCVGGYAGGCGVVWINGTADSVARARATGVNPRAAQRQKTHRAKEGRQERFPG